MRYVLVAVALAFACSAQARITDPGTPKVEPFAEGAQFGATGAYERVSGVAKGDVIGLAAFVDDVGGGA